jgi:hypothetical protein
VRGHDDVEVERDSRFEYALAGVVVDARQGLVEHHEPWRERVAVERRRRREQRQMDQDRPLAARAHGVTALGQPDAPKIAPLVEPEREPAPVVKRAHQRVRHRLGFIAEGMLAAGGLDPSPEERDQFASRLAAEVVDVATQQRERCPLRARIVL